MSAPRALSPLKTSHDTNLPVIVGINCVVGALSRKWTVSILQEMRRGPVRLSYLRRALPSASKKGLVTSLRDLEALHLVIRRDLSTSTLHIEYELSPDVREHLILLLEFLSRWAIHLGCAGSTDILMDSPPSE